MVEPVQPCVLMTNFVWRPHTPDWQAQVNVSQRHATIFAGFDCHFLENKVLSRFDAERIDHDDAFFIDEFEVLIRFRDRLRLANHGE